MNAVAYATTNSKCAANGKCCTYARYGNTTAKNKNNNNYCKLSNTHKSNENVAHI